MVRARFIITWAVMIAWFSLLGLSGARAQEGDFTRIYGIVFLDANRNGVQDSGEPGIGPVLLIIRSPDPGQPWEASGIANNAGSWDFAALNPSTYTISIEVPPGYINTTPTSISVRVTGDP